MRGILIALLALLLASPARASVAAADDWTDAERWAWTQIEAGQAADFNAACHAPATPPNDDAAWNAPCRTVRGSVLEQMLTRAPWRDAMQHRGLWLVGAHVTGGLDLANAHVAAALGLTQSRIEGDVQLSRARFDNVLAFDGSALIGTLNGVGLQSDSDVLLSDGLSFARKGPCAPAATPAVQARQPVTFRNAHIKGSLLLNCGHFADGFDISGAHIDEEVQTGGGVFDAGLRGGSVQIGIKLSINASRFGGDVLLTNATIGGLVDASFSTFAGTLSLVDSHIAGDVFLNGGSFERKGVNLSGVHVDGYVSLWDATVLGAVDATNAQIGGDVTFNGKSHVEGSVLFSGVRVGGSLEMSKTHFSGKVSVRGAHVAGDANMLGTEFGQALDLLGMRADGDVKLTGSQLADDLVASNLQTGHDLDIDRGARVAGEANLFDVHVGNSLHMEGASFQKSVLAQNLRVGADLLVASTFAAPLVLAGVNVGGQLGFGGASLSDVDLTGATIGGALQIDGRTQWHAPARLSLVNANAGRLQDGMVGQHEPCPTDEQPPVGNGWPSGRTLELDGFTYGHLGALSGASGTNMRERDSCWWRWWLERDGEFSSQPYAQLASVMTAHGDQENAARVLYFGRVRETRMAWEAGHYLRWALLATLNLVTGYGIGTYTFRVILWIFGFTLLGVALLWPRRGKRRFWWLFGASLNRVLPGIEMNKEFADFFDDPDRKNLQGMQVFFFSALVVIGWALGLFLVAAMSGLTQHS